MQQSKKVYAIQHSFRNELIIPVGALYHNLDFFIENDEKSVNFVKTSDGKLCIVKKFKVEHLCDLCDDIKRIYQINIEDFLTKWHNAMCVSSMYFILMELQEYGV